MARQPRRKCAKCEGEIPFGRHNDYCSVKCEKIVEGYHPFYARRLDREWLKVQIQGGLAWAPPELEAPKKLVTGYPVLIVNDVHCPMQSASWTEQSLVAAHKFGARTCIINGDLINADQISKYAGAAFRGKATLEDDMNSAEKFLELYCSVFDEVYYTLGNHTARLIRQMAGELSIQRLLKMIYDSPKLKVASKTWMSVNQNIRVLHPRNYSQIRGKATAETANLYQCHLITGHHHHSCTTATKDARFQVVEVGCLANTDLMGYVHDNMNNMPMMMNGFAIIEEKDLILNFNKFSSWKTFGLPDMEGL